MYGGAEAGDRPIVCKELQDVNSKRQRALCIATGTGAEKGELKVGVRQNPPAGAPRSASVPFSQEGAGGCFKSKLDQNWNRLSSGPRERKCRSWCASAVPRAHRFVRAEGKLFEKRMDLGVNLNKDLIAGRSLAFACCFCW